MGDPRTSSTSITGPHTVTLRKGCLAGEAVLVVADGDPQEVSLALEEKPGNVTLKVTPVEAALTIDGVLIEGLQGRSRRLACGSHTVRAERVGHVPAVVTLEVGPGQDIVVPLTLDPIGTGTLAIDVVPFGAAVFLDGEPLTLVAGKTEIPQGAHAVRAESEGYLPLTRQFAQVATGLGAVLAATGAGLVIAF